jgi:hypothetical protein
MRSALVLACAATALTGCVSKIAYPRVKGALVEAGLSDGNASCMAGRMTDKLSIGQLRKLEALRGDKRSVADYVLAVRRVGDAEVLAVTASSAALCTTGFAR